MCIKESGYRVLYYAKSYIEAVSEGQSVTSCRYLRWLRRPRREVLVQGSGEQMKGMEEDKEALQQDCLP